MKVLVDCINWGGRKEATRQQQKRVFFLHFIITRIHLGPEMNKSESAVCNISFYCCDDYYNDVESGRVLLILARARNHGAHTHTRGAQKLLINIEALLLLLLGRCTEPRALSTPSPIDPHGRTRREKDRKQIPS